MLHRDWYTDPTSPPMPIYDELLSHLGQQWLIWEPETVWDELRERFGDLHMPDGTKDKILAGQLMATTNVPWSDWHPFLGCCLAINGIPVGEDFSPCSPSQLAYGITILRRMKPGLEFDSEPRNMTAAMLASEGLVWVPADPIGSMIGDAREVMAPDYPREQLAEAIAQEYDSYAPGSEEISMPLARVLVIDEYLRNKKSREDEMRG
jgi:hypothetical protein